jgi:hypothetical protein
VEAKMVRRLVISLCLSFALLGVGTTSAQAAEGIGKDSLGGPLIKLGNEVVSVGVSQLKGIGPIGKLSRVTGIAASQANDIWVSTMSAFTLVDGIPGPIGAPGQKGEPGEPGFRGFAGPQGPQGMSGSKGETGEIGATGISLEGAAGTDGDDGADGTDGKSAYQIWYDENNCNSDSANCTEADFLNSLVGASGEDGLVFDIGLDPNRMTCPNNQKITSLVIIDNLLGVQCQDGGQGNTNNANEGNGGFTPPNSNEMQPIANSGENGNRNQTGSQEPATTGVSGLSAYEVWVAEQLPNSDTSIGAYFSAIKGDIGDDAFTVWAKSQPVSQGKKLVLADYFAAIKGDRGDKGDRGEVGPAGPAGPQGASAYETWKAALPKTGNPDTSVAAFLASIKGDPGPQGQTGQSGPQGQAGQVGATGSQGPAGPIGPQGPKGDTGAQGTTGLQGPAGAKGDPGPKGDKGDTGAQGPAGTVDGFTSQTICVATNGAITWGACSKGGTQYEVMIK